VTEEVRTRPGTYIWLEGGVQHACFQPPEVEVLEERVLLHFLGPSSSAPQALQRVFAQELQHNGKQCLGGGCFGQEQPGSCSMSLGMAQARKPAGRARDEGTLDPPALPYLRQGNMAATSTSTGSSLDVPLLCAKRQWQRRDSDAHSYHGAEGAGAGRELLRVLLLHFLHQPLHLLPLDLLLALLEGGLSLDHLVHQAAQSPPVWAECVALVLHHLRSYTGAGVRDV